MVATPLLGQLGLGTPITRGNRHAAFFYTTCRNNTIAPVRILLRVAPVPGSLALISRHSDLNNADSWAVPICVARQRMDSCGVCYIREPVAHSSKLEPSLCALANLQRPRQPMADHPMWSRSQGSQRRHALRFRCAVAIRTDLARSARRPFLALGQDVPEVGGVLVSTFICLACECVPRHAPKCCSASWQRTALNSAMPECQHNAAWKHARFSRPKTSTTMYASTH